jgi:glycerol-3-phosphate dehydrogenase
LSAADVLHTTAGVRALVKSGGSESSVSRMHKVVSGPPVGPPGVVSVLGGKITGYRAIAEEVTDVLCRTLKHQRRCVTAEEPLPGAAKRPATAPPALDLYGARAAEVVQIGSESPELMEPLSPKHAEIGAQAAHAARHEHCVHLSDFLRRRTLLGASEDQGLVAAAPAARIMGRELGWSAEREAQELAAYRRDAVARRGRVYR